MNEVSGMGTAKKRGPFKMKQPTKNELRARLAAVTSAARYLEERVELLKAEIAYLRAPWWVHARAAIKARFAR
jgi:hypothetical protein